jgi:hypothetical protein
MHARAHAHANPRTRQRARASARARANAQTPHVQGTFWIAEEDRAVIAWASAGPVFTPEVQGLSACHWARTYLPTNEREAALASLLAADAKKLPQSGKKPQRTRPKSSEGGECTPVEDIDWGWVPLYDDRKTEIVLIGVGMDEAAISTALEGALLTAEEEAEITAPPPANGEEAFAGLRGTDHPFAEMTKMLVGRLDEAKSDARVREGLNQSIKATLSQSGVVFKAT